MDCKARAFVPIIIILLMVAAVSAQDEAPEYNFGTMQAEKAITLEPGESYSANIYVFNINGNRITHVAFNVVEAPPDWDVTLEPSIHSVTTNISGELIEVSENLYAEPTSTVAAPPDPVPEGMEYLEAGSVDGFIPAKVLRVNIRVPKSAPLGKTEKITVNAKATWLGQGGMVVLSQDRNFDFTVKTITRKFTEEIVKTTEPPVDASTQAGLSPLKYVAYGAGAVILILIILTVIVKALKKD